MRIKIEKGQKVQDVIHKLEDFFKKYSEGYDVLLNDASLYINLCSEDKEKFTSNIFNYQITKNGSYCEEEMIMESIKPQVLQRIINSANRNKKDALNAHKEGEATERYLKNAKDKGFSTVEKWEKKLEEAMVFERKAPNIVKFYETIIWCVKEKKVNWEFSITRDYSSKYYTVKVLPIIDSKKEVFRSEWYYSDTGFSDVRPGKVDWITTTRRES